MTKKEKKVRKRLEEAKTKGLVSYQFYLPITIKNKILKKADKEHRNIKGYLLNLIEKDLGLK